MANSFLDNLSKELPKNSFNCLKSDAAAHVCSDPLSILPHDILLMKFKSHLWAGYPEIKVKDINMQQKICMHCNNSAKQYESTAHHEEQRVYCLHIQLLFCGCCRYQDFWGDICHRKRISLEDLDIWRIFSKQKCPYIYSSSSRKLCPSAMLWNQKLLCIPEFYDLTQPRWKHMRIMNSQGNLTGCYIHIYYNGNTTYVIFRYLLL